MSAKNSKTEAEELRMLFEISIDDIRYAKRQQWAVTYYGLLLIGGILGFYRLISSENNVSYLGKGFLFILTLIIAVVGSIYLCIFQDSLKKYRNRILEIRKKLPEADRILGEEPPDYSKFRYYFSLIIIPFMSALGLGVLFVYWVLYWR